MKLLQKNKDIVFVLSVFICFKIIIVLALVASVLYIPENSAYVNLNRFGNFDGIHYLSIAEYGYGDFQQAFFPVYPLLISLIHKVSSFSYIFAGLFISNLAFFGFLFFFHKLIKKEMGVYDAGWATVLCAALPMAFFMQGVYTEALFMFLVILVFYFLNAKKYFTAFILAGITSGTRVVGIFLAPIIILNMIFLREKFTFMSMIKKIIFFGLGIGGFIGYVAYLKIQYNDPLLFVHVQSAFGANRSSGEIIFLPQVLFRYIKILFLVDPKTLTYWVSFTELATFLISFLMCLVAFRKKIPLPYILFSVAVILFPSLSGTLSSIPRYSLAAFIVPIVLVKIIHASWLRYILLFLMILLQCIFASIFFAGYFVS